MDQERAAALRKRFPASAVGVLPKPYKKDSPKGKCDVCGGFHGLPAVHLDYVGHAAVTSRLLEVDPDWTWEPFAVDPVTGLPAFDPGRNLWIRLTVAGVTRIGVGDGMSLKECIGDAIRNAAMRFGVALDLWAKGDLDESGEAAAAVSSAPASTTRVVRRPAAREDSALTTAEKRMFALLTKKGYADRDASLAYVGRVIDRPIATRKDLTPTEVSQVIKDLETHDDAPNQPTPEEQVAIVAAERAEAGV